PLNQYLRVGVAHEWPAGRGEILAEFAGVVDRAVEDDADRPTRPQHPLVARRAQIEDRQPAVAKNGAVPLGEALTVGTPPGKRVETRGHEASISRASNRSSDAAHQRESRDAALGASVAQDASPAACS